MTVYLCDEATGDIVREATAREVKLAKVLATLTYETTRGMRFGFLARVEESTDADGDTTRIAIALTDDEIGAL